MDGLVESGLEDEIEPRATSRAICSGCGENRPGYDRLAPRRFQFVPLWNVAVFFVNAMRCVDCPQCGVTVERVPRGASKEHLNASYLWFLARRAKRLSWKEAADMRNTNIALDQMRRANVAQLRRDGYERILAKARRYLLTRPENLPEHQEVRLNEI